MRHLLLLLLLAAARGAHAQAALDVLRAEAPGDAAPVPAVGTLAQTDPYENLNVDPSHNPASPRIPERWVKEAGARELVAVGGADGGTNFGRMVSQGMGGADAPFSEIQSVEAAAALLELADPARDTIFVWGFGDPLVSTATYAYKTDSGKLLRLRALNQDAVGPAFGGFQGYSRYTEGQAYTDARALERALETSPVLDGKPALVVGHSWAAVVVSYGLTHVDKDAPKDTVLRVPGVALAAPQHIFTGPDPLKRNTEDQKDWWSLLLPLPADGAYDALYLARRPDDQVAAGGLKPLFARFQGPTHDYRLLYHLDDGGQKVPGGFWGVSGPGVLSAAVLPAN